MTERTCFIICPIGSENSPERKRADQLLKHVITKTLKEFNFTIIRADIISRPGIITSQIIENLISADLVIADLQGFNPNVFYELGIRHAINKPVIQIFNPEEKLPFDVSSVRSIKLDIRDLDSVEKCIDELKQQVQSILSSPAAVDSPFSVAVDIRTLRSTDGLIEKGLTDIIEGIQVIQNRIVNLEKITENKYTLSDRSYLIGSTQQDRGYSEISPKELFSFLEKSDWKLIPKKNGAWGWAPRNSVNKTEEEE